MEIKELNELSKAFFNAKKILEAKKAETKIAQEDCDELESKLLKACEENDLKCHESPYGKFFVQSRLTVKVPQGDDRKAFFDYLKSIGAFDALITVNSQTLNSFYKQKVEENPSNVAMPGLGLPSEYKYLNTRQS